MAFLKVVDFRQNTFCHSDPERSEGEESTNFRVNALNFVDSSPCFCKAQNDKSTLFKKELLNFC